MEANFTKARGDRIGREGAVEVISSLVTGCEISQWKVPQIET